MNFSGKLNLLTDQYINLLDFKVKKDHSTEKSANNKSFLGKEFDLLLYDKESIPCYYNSKNNIDSANTTNIRFFSTQSNELLFEKQNGFYQEIRSILSAALETDENFGSDFFEIINQKNTECNFFNDTLIDIKKLKQAVEEIREDFIETDDEKDLKEIKDNEVKKKVNYSFGYAEEIDKFNFDFNFQQKPMNDNRSLLRRIIDRIIWGTEM